MRHDMRSMPWRPSRCSRVDLCGEGKAGVARVSKVVSLVEDSVRIPVTSLATQQCEEQRHGEKGVQDTGWKAQGHSVLGVPATPSA